MSKKALIAMSGGVDSAVAALLMKEQGYDCIGITMRLFDNEDIFHDENLKSHNSRSCCSMEDAELAEKVANRIGIPFYVMNLADDFRKDVMNRFVDGYKNGITPNPCIDCNRYIKFDRLFTKATQLGIDHVVTGHYAQIEEKTETINNPNAPDNTSNLNDHSFILKKAADLSKDQSYVLYSLTQDQLRRLKLPLGGLTKLEVRAIAAKNGFANAEKPDSQDICFVRDGDYATFITQYTGEDCSEGHFLDTSGQIIGTHKGHIRYTIGQRKGLGIALGKPMYVCAKDPMNNTVTLCEDAELYANGLYAGDFNWISQPWITQQTTIRAKAKIRYSHKEEWVTAEIVENQNNKVKITFDQPQRAIAPGQAVVLYDGDVVIGGGTIL